MNACSRVYALYICKPLWKGAPQCCTVSQALLSTELAPPQYGKDFYYRTHPDDLKKFYAAIDEFHNAYDTLTEFESLSGVAAQMLPGRSVACFCAAVPDNSHQTPNPARAAMVVSPFICLSCKGALFTAQNTHAQGLRMTRTARLPIPQNTLACSLARLIMDAGYQKRRQNIMGPSVGPTSANAAVTQFLLAHAK